VPTLYTALSSGALATNKNVYGEFTHPFVLEKDEIVDIVINNDDPGKHPFHLHGHSFQTIWRSDEDAGAYNPETDTAFPEFPMRRDTLMVRPGGNMVMRFKADNPGVWLFHCHIEWHVDSGLIATIIESPLSLQQSVTIPQNHKDACAAVGVQTAGNAAGNTVDFLDLAGQNEPPHRLPDGWTAKGIVAMTFSCLAALLGLVAITWYGLADMGAAEFEHERRRIAEAGIPVDDD
jgi:iron transport multicopper oxidase